MGELELEAARSGHFEDDGSGSVATTDASNFDSRDDESYANIPEPEDSIIPSVTPTRAFDLLDGSNSKKCSKP